MSRRANAPIIKLPFLSKELHRKMWIAQVEGDCRLLIEADYGKVELHATWFKNKIRHMTAIRGMAPLNEAQAIRFFDDAWSRLLEEMRRIRGAEVQGTDLGDSQTS